MLWRRRKRDGFVWEKHVRTVIIQRRADRARKREAVAEAVRVGGRRAGEAMNVAARETGTRAGTAFRHIFDYLARASVAAARAIWAFVVYTARATFSGCVDAARAVAIWLKDHAANRQPGQARPRKPSRGDGGKSSTLDGLLGMWRRLPRPSPRFPAVSIGQLASPQWLAGHLSPTRIAFAAGLATAGALLLLVNLPAPSVSGALASVAQVFSTTETVSGRARAVTGDTLRVDGRLIQIADVDAPELGQACRTRGGRRWRCGRRARTALRQLVRRAVVTCEVWEGEHAADTLGHCRIGERDLAEALLSAGRVFAARDATQSAFDREADARAGRRGVWQGRAEHPADYRERLWAQAAERAPGGCPIKARKRRGERVYVTPWASGYRRTRVREARGDRWFCSEADAVAAGWRAA